MRRVNRTHKDVCGFALITALIVTAVTAALVLAFITQVNTEQKIAQNDTDYSNAFYAAEAGLEKINSDLSKLFAAKVFPNQDDVDGLMDEDRQPLLTDVTFRDYTIHGGHSTFLDGALSSSATTATVDSTDGWPTSGFFMIDAEEFTYTGKTATTFTGVARGQAGSVAAAHNNNASVVRAKVVTLSEGDYSGLTAQMIPFTIEVTAQAGVGTEAKLTREVQAALIPVFQFGMFSDSDLGFFAGPTFTFNGRIHTNGNLFLTTGATLNLNDKVTAYKEVVRRLMPNGQAGFAGTVNLKSGTSTTRALAVGEASYDPGASPGVLPPPAPPTGRWAGWTSMSLTTYNGYLKNGLTGARNLKLPFVAEGYANNELIRRPPAGEAVDTLMGESRLANQASLRVFISDAAANLPGGTGYVLNNTLSGYAGTPFAEANPNDPDFVTSAAGGTTDETTSAPLIGGYVLIQRKNDDNTWTDVTMEILGLGISTSDTNAVLRFQKPKWDKTGNTAIDYIPINMFDTQEGRFRNGSDSLSTTSLMRKLGIMNLVELNVGKLKEWLAGTIGSTGTSTATNNGYLFYFSDRRGNRNAAGEETGELGFEDTINPADTEGDPNGALNPAEDLNGNGVLDVYGARLPYSPYTASTDLYTTGVPFQTALTPIVVTETLTTTDTSFNVSAVTGMATGYYRIDNEIVACTSVSSSPITCVRGQLGTTAATHTPSSAAIDLSANINSTTTSIPVSSDANVTVPRYYRIDDEAVLCTAKASNVLTCQRAQLGTTAATHSVVGNWVNMNLTSTTTPITVVNGASFPTGNAWYRIDNEIIYCTRSSNTLTCTSGRGQLGTTAASHPLVSVNLSSAVTSTGTTTFTFSSTASFTVPAYYRIGSEVINCTAKSVSSPWTMTCARAQEGTTASTYSTGTAVQTRMNIRLVNVLPANLLPSQRASKNRVHYFRRALRLVNGASPNLPDPGFTVAAENIVYVLGNYNSNGTTGWTDPHSHAAVMGDAVTLLSNAWISGGDDLSFRYPHDRSLRPSSTTWYRTAIASGKGITFTKPSTEADQFFGTDGGAHNFLRYLEDWTGDISHYKGSIVSLYLTRQAVGPFKCCTSVYNPPDRDYSFDLEFLVPSQLPPGTPRFRDINNLSFRQTIRADTD